MSKKVSKQEAVLVVDIDDDGVGSQAEPVIAARPRPVPAKQGKPLQDAGLTVEDVRERHARELAENLAKAQSSAASAIQEALAALTAAMDLEGSDDWLRIQEANDKAAKASEQAKWLKWRADKLAANQGRETSFTSEEYAAMLESDAGWRAANVQYTRAKRVSSSSLRLVSLALLEDWSIGRSDDGRPKRSQPRGMHRNAVRTMTASAVLEDVFTGQKFTYQGVVQFKGAFYKAYRDWHTDDYRYTEDGGLYFGSGLYLKRSDGGQSKPLPKRSSEDGKKAVQIALETLDALDAEDTVFQSEMDDVLEVSFA